MGIIKGIPTDIQDGGTTMAAMDTLEADILTTGTDRTVIMTVESGYPRRILGCGSGTMREH